MKVTGAGKEPGFDLAVRDVAAISGLHCWLALRSFQILGQWASNEPEPSAKVHFHTFSLHYYRLASALKREIPAVAQLGGAAEFVPPAFGFVEALDASLGVVAAIENTSSRVSVRYGSLIPWYRGLLRNYPAPTRVISSVGSVIESESLSARTEIASYQELYDSGQEGIALPQVHIDLTGKM